MSKRLIEQMAQSLVETLWPPKKGDRDGTSSYKSWDQLTEAARNKWRGHAAVLIARVGEEKITDTRHDAILDALARLEERGREIASSQECTGVNCAGCELGRAIHMLRNALNLGDDVLEDTTTTDEETASA